MTVRVLLCSTGSVASIKLPLIVAELLKYDGVEIEVISTSASLAFYDFSSVEKNKVKVWKDEDEWRKWTKVGDPIAHIELRRWADIVLVAPCSANTLAKIANGICDNLLTSLLRALTKETPTYIFPAMNTHMYEHPLTAKQMKIVREEIGYNIVGPISKGLACGDQGLGAMTEWKDIVQLVVDKFSLKLKVQDDVA
ncbi:flavoprotein [Atractiella rhizophila]|nr:flavoprotein [Atractiella rhizophila]